MNLNEYDVERRLNELEGAKKFLHYLAAMFFGGSLVLVVMGSPDASGVVGVFAIASVFCAHFLDEDRKSLKEKFEQYQVGKSSEIDIEILAYRVTRPLIASLKFWGY